MTKQILTIDIGGTKIRIVQFRDNKNFEVKHETEFPTPADPYILTSELADTIRQQFPDFAKFSKDNIVTIATRSRKIVDGKVTGSLLGMTDFPIAKLLSKQIDRTKVLVENDSKMGALGAFPTNFTGRGLYVTIGTGIGCGLIINGQLSHDLFDMEAGKMILRLPDEGFATWEGIASGTALSAKHGVISDDILADDPIWRKYADDLSLGLYALLPVVRVNKIVFGGKIGDYFEKFGKRLAHNLRAVSKNDSWFDDVELSSTDSRYVVNRGAAIFTLNQSDDK